MDGVKVNKTNKVRFGDRRTRSLGRWVNLGLCSNPGVFIIGLKDIFIAK